MVAKADVKIVSRIPAASISGPGTEPDAGKPAAESTSVAEAPQRFSADAKAAWPTVPEAVKDEVHRGFRELESGLTRYRQIFEPLKPFYQMAEQHETTVADALGRYTALDLQLVPREIVRPCSTRSANACAARFRTSPAAVG